MSKWTKADIDDLLARRPLDMMEPDFWASKAARMSLYLAAGLTAEGAPKPRKVRCYMYRHRNDAEPRGITIGRPQLDMSGLGWEIVGGTFVPDGDS